MRNPVFNLVFNHAFYLLLLNRFTTALRLKTAALIGFDSRVDIIYTFSNGEVTFNTLVMIIQQLFTLNCYLWWGCQLTQTHWQYSCALTVLCLCVCWYVQWNTSEGKTIGSKISNKIRIGELLLTTSTSCFCLCLCFSLVLAARVG